jgi:hypothetical protein
MAKTKKHARTKRHNAPRREASRSDPASREVPGQHIEPKPPRKNLPLLVLCSVLLFGFLIYLAIIAWTAIQP